MSRSVRKSAAFFLVCVVGAGVLISQSSGQRSNSLETVLAAAGSARWFRGNLHTHSYWSDADDYPEMIAVWYRDRGYQFLGFSDHNTTQTGQRWIDAKSNKLRERAYEKLRARFPEGWVEERTHDDKFQVRLKTFDELAAKLNVRGEFLLIRGEEITDHFRRSIPVHLGAVNLKTPLPPMRGDSVYDTMQNNVDAVIAQRERTGQPMIVHLNHPNFGFGITAEDLMRVRGENFFEVYNGHPSVLNEGDAAHASAERIWDIVLTWRIDRLGLPLMYGLASDDGHNYHAIPSRGSDPGRGWLMVLADDLSAPTLIDALENGRFYATTGVTLREVRSSARKLTVATEPVAGETMTIEFFGTRKGFDSSREPVIDGRGRPVRTTKKYSSDVGCLLKSATAAEATYEFQGDELYVRARVTSSRRHPDPSTPGEFERAWVQPVKGPAAPR